MHSAQYGSLTFHYNGDHTGVIYISDDTHEQIETSFRELVKSLDKVESIWNDEETEAIAEFLGQAVILRRISELEQLSGRDALADPSLFALLGEIA